MVTVTLRCRDGSQSNSLAVMITMTSVVSWSHTGMTVVTYGHGAAVTHGRVSIGT